MTIKVAVIGLGGIALKGHMPVLTEREDVELMFYSRSQEKLENLMKKYRVKEGYSDIEKIIQSKPDAAFILTPVVSHFELTEKFLNAGIDVMLEKPATDETRTAKKLAELADARDRVLMVAFNRRFAPLSIKAKQVWADRSVAQAIFEKHRSKPGYPDFFSYMNEELIHTIDLLRFFCGEAEVISTRFLEEGGKLVRASSMLMLENGGYATVAGCLTAGHWFEHYAMHGGEASLYMDAFYQVTMATGDSKQTWEQPYASSWDSNLKGRGFVDQIDHFLNCVKNHQKPLTDAWECYKTQLLVESMVEKAKI